MSRKGENSDNDCRSKEGTASGAPADSLDEMIAEAMTLARSAPKATERIQALKLYDSLCARRDAELQYADVPEELSKFMGEFAR